MKIGFIGLGGAGGSQIKRSRELGYRTLEINNTYNDISDITSNHVVLKSGIDGTNKDRKVSLNIIKENIEFLSEKLDETFKNEDIVFIVSSAGGGFGSGANPIINTLLRSIGKIAISILYMPNINEDWKYINNAIKCLEDLNNDNLKLTYSLVKSRADVQSLFLDIFKNRIPSDLKEGKFNLDGAEAKYIFTRPGMLSIQGTEFVCDSHSSKVKLYYGIGKSFEIAENNLECQGMERYKAIYDKNILDDEKEYIIYSGGTPEQAYIDTLVNSIEEQLKNRNERKISIQKSESIEEKEIEEEIEKEEEGNNNLQDLLDFFS